MTVHGQAESNESCKYLQHILPGICMTQLFCRVAHLTEPLIEGHRFVTIVGSPLEVVCSVDWAPVVTMEVVRVVTMEVVRVDMSVSLPWPPLHGVKSL